MSGWTEVYTGAITVLSQKLHSQSWACQYKGAYEISSESVNHFSSYPAEMEV